MEELSDKEFKDFIESYRYGSYEDEYHNIHHFHDTVTELSRSSTDKADPLIENSQEMYGLDWIVKASNRFGDKLPKSTDALFLKEDKNGNLSLHIIEFKFIGKWSYKNKFNYLWKNICQKLNCENCYDCDTTKTNECFHKHFVSNFKDIRNNFKDPINISLQLKPYEVIYITLPELYEEYCANNPDITKKDINHYLNNIDKYYWTFIGNLSMNKSHIEAKANDFNEYNKRLEMTIFKKARAKPFCDFDDVLHIEILKNKSLDDKIDDDSLSDLLIID